MFPDNWTVSGYTTAWTRFNFARYFTNTATAAVVTTLFTVIVSAATGYAFAKYKAWWLKVFFVCILATTMLPTEVIMPSTFVVIRDLGLYDTLAGIIVPSIMTATGTFMFRQYFKTVPDELMEAARIDGASELRIFASIMLPLARPIAITLAIFSFHWRWNDYIWPLLVLKDQKLYTLQVALRSIVGADNIDWSVLLSASVISLVPMVVIFLVLLTQIGADLLTRAVRRNVFFTELGQLSVGTTTEFAHQGTLHWTKSWSIGMNSAPRAPSWAPRLCGFWAIFAKMAPNRWRQSKRRCAPATRAGW